MASTDRDPSMISSFHRMEALVFSDSSDRFAEWPTDVGPKGINFRTVLPDRVVSYPRGNGRRSPKLTAAGQTALLKRKLAALPPSSTADESPPPPPFNHMNYGANAESLKPPKSYASDDAQVIHLSSAASSHEQVKNAVSSRPEGSTKLDLLQRAEQLLGAVRRTLRTQHGNANEMTTPRKTELHVIDDSAASPVEYEAEIYSLLEDRYAHLKRCSQNEHSSFHNDTSVPGSDMEGIQWLLRGVPDVYCHDDQPSEDVLGDEAVDRLLKQGGPTPSQLVFPSFYEYSQKKIEQLKFAKKLRITLTHINVYGAEFGLRKKGTFVMLTPPSGEVVEDLSGLPRRIDLFELEDDTLMQSRSTKRKHVNVLQDYFVGSASLGDDKCVQWEISLTDEVVKSWISSYQIGERSDLAGRDNLDSKGYIKVEIFSPLRPSGPSRSPTVRLGQFSIPMCGILGAAHCFDVVLSSEIALDSDSNTVIKQRLERMPTGGTRSAARSAGSSSLASLGTMSCRVTLLRDNGAPLYMSGDRNAATKAVPEEGRKKRQIPSSAIVNAVDPKTIDCQSAVVSNSKILDDAMKYLPNETGVSNLESTAFVGVGCHRCVLDAYFLKGLVETFDECLPRLKVSVEYKISVESGSLRHVTSGSVLWHLQGGGRQFTAAKDEAVSLMQRISFDENTSSRLFEISDISKWRPMLFEVWVEWTSGDIFSQRQRKILGVAKFSEVTVFRPRVRLPVRRLGDDSSIVGMLEVSCCLGNSKSKIETLIKDAMLLSRVDTDYHECPATATIAQVPADHRIDDAVDSDAVILVAPTASDMDLIPRDCDPPAPIRQTPSPHLRRKPEAPTSPFRNQSNKDESSTDTCESQTELFGLQEYAASFDCIRHSAAVGLNFLPLQSSQSEREIGTGQHTVADLPLPNELGRNINELSSPVPAIVSRETYGALTDNSGVVPDICLKEHLLDFCVDGPSLALYSHLFHDAHEGMESIGFYLFYEIPGLVSEHVNEGGGTPNGCEKCFSLWWDKHSSVLNSHGRHVFDVEIERRTENSLRKSRDMLDGLTGSKDFSKQSDCDDSCIEYVSALRSKFKMDPNASDVPFIIFKVFASDAYGGISCSSQCAATAVLSVEQFLSCVKSSGVEKVLELPLTFEKAFLHMSGEKMEMPTALLHLRSSNIIQPKLSINRSNETLNRGHLASESESPQFDLSLPQLPLLSRVRDFVWNNLETGNSAEFINESGTEVPSVQTGPSIEYCGLLKLELEAFAHCSEVTELFRAPLRSWRSIVGSPRLVFSGNLFCSKKCSNCHSVGNDCVCAINKDQYHVPHEWSSRLIFKSEPLPVGDIFAIPVSIGNESSAEALERSIEAGSNSSSIVYINNLNPIQIDVPAIDHSGETPRHVLSLCTLQISVHIQYNWTIPETNAVRFENSVPLDDIIIGSVAVDLYPVMRRSSGGPDALDSMQILVGLQEGIDGWYHIIDGAQKGHGQLKLKLRYVDKDNYRQIESFNMYPGESHEILTVVDGEETGFSPTEYDANNLAMKTRLERMLKVLDEQNKFYINNGYCVESSPVEACELKEDFIARSEASRSYEGHDLCDEYLTGYEASLSNVEFTTASLRPNSTFAKEPDDDIEDFSELPLEHSNLSVIAGDLEDDSDNWQDGFLFPDVSEPVNGVEISPCCDDGVEDRYTSHYISASFDAARCDFERDEFIGSLEINLPTFVHGEVKVTRASYKEEMNESDKKDYDSFETSPKCSLSSSSDSSSIYFSKEVIEETTGYDSFFAEPKSSPSKSPQLSFHDLDVSNEASDVHLQDVESILDVSLNGHEEMNGGVNDLDSDLQRGEFGDDVSSLNDNMDKSIEGVPEAESTLNEIGLDLNRVNQSSNEHELFDEPKENDFTETAEDIISEPAIKESNEGSSLMLDPSLKGSVCENTDAIPVLNVLNPTEENLAAAMDVVLSDLNYKRTRDLSATIVSDEPQISVVVRDIPNDNAFSIFSKRSDEKKPVDIAQLVRSVVAKHDGKSKQEDGRQASTESRFRPFPGRRRKFVELETSRISKIMFGSKDC